MMHPYIKKEHKLRFVSREDRLYLVIILVFPKVTIYIWGHYFDGFLCSLLFIYGMNEFSNKDTAINKK